MCIGTSRANGFIAGRARIVIVDNLRVLNQTVWALVGLLSKSRRSGNARRFLVCTAFLAAICGPPSANGTVVSLPIDQFAQLSRDQNPGMPVLLRHDGRGTLLTVMGDQVVGPISGFNGHHEAILGFDTSTLVLPAHNLQITGNMVMLATGVLPGRFSGGNSIGVGLGLTDAWTAPTATWNELGGQHVSSIFDSGFKRGQLAHEWNLLRAFELDGTADMASEISDGYLTLHLYVRDPRIYEVLVAESFRIELEFQHISVSAPTTLALLILGLAGLSFVRTGSCGAATSSVSTARTACS